MTRRHDGEIPELFDTNNVTDTPEHWAKLAERITAHVTLGANSVEWLARSRAGWIGAFSILAASVVLLLSTPRPDWRDSTHDEWTWALVPENNAARMLLQRDGPPRIESVVFVVRGEAR
jgi:hypothetical protein